MLLNSGLRALRHSNAKEGGESHVKRLFYASLRRLTPYAPVQAPMPKPAEPEIESTGPNQWEVAAHAVPGEQDWCASESLHLPALHQHRTRAGCVQTLTLSAVCAPCRVYHARKNANDGKGDAVANQLEYKPVCTHMPVCKEQCADATFIWVRFAVCCAVCATVVAELSCLATAADQEEGAALNAGHTRQTTGDGVCAVL